jgi:polyhydroxyalkanoate synthesis regulator phasin
MFTGIGVMSLTKDKVEEVAQEFVEKGKLSQQEGEKLVGEILRRSEESKQEFQKQVEERVNEVLNKVDFATKSDIAALRDEIAELKAKLDGNEPA